MCGIVGYIGDEPAAPLLLDGLEKLEYRGYDSAGIAVFDEDAIKIVKAKGKLSVLKNLVAGRELSGCIGIGHTRWATHGEPSVPNAHPHFNASRTIAVVHNGIIENYTEMRKYLSEKGYRFISDTDTEVVAHLLDYYYSKTNDPKEAISRMLTRIEGSYALGMLFADFPDTVFAARKDSPLAIGLGTGCNFIASDAPAIIKHTRDVIYIGNREIAEIKKDSVEVFNLDLEPLKKEAVRIEWDVEAAEKNGFEHFMLKEIYEQPAAIKNTVYPRISGSEINLDESGLSDDGFSRFKKIYVVACGSAYHAGVVGKYVIEKLARIPVETDLASEFRYRDPIYEKDALCVVISQSGETADTLAALREAKKHGVFTLGIVNVVGSSIAREADGVIYTHAGPEISVATTKAYSAQLAVTYLLALKLARLRGTLDDKEYRDYVDELKTLHEKAAQLLGDNEDIQRYAAGKAGERDIFFIGRGIDYAAALEGSLKLKEISYIHSEAYAAGELKHGTISLIEKNTLVISLATQPDLFEKMKSNSEEVACRGADVFMITQAEAQADEKADFSVSIPDVLPAFSASLSVIPLQLFAYYVCLTKGLDVDKPRNLAKSVTVE